MASTKRKRPRQDTSQSSTTLLPQLVAQGFENNGLDSTDAAFFSVSLTSTNNFINFCTTVPDLPITNGKELLSGSCNPTPMGQIPAAQKMPATRITQPVNGQIFTEGSTIFVSFKTINFKSGFLTNPASNYLSAPQQLSSDGFIMGHHHLVIEKLDSFDQRSPTDPTVFAFFKEVQSETSPVANVTLSPGFYRLTVTAHTANHQPVIVPQPIHGSVNDAIFFTVTGSLTKRDADVYGPLAPTGKDRRSSHRLKPVRSSIAHRSPSRRQDALDSLTLDPSVIASGFADNGVQTNTSGNITPSLTSTNNFINFCATLPTISLTNGLSNGTQTANGSCNPALIGILPSSQNMPSIKFVKPAFNDTLKENSAFDVSFNVTNLSIANLANPATNYLAAPQQAGAAGVLGHVLVVIETVPTDVEANIASPTVFDFFSGVTGFNLVGGLFTLSIENGLQSGSYKLSSMVLTVNHQPVVLPVAQHGAVDDVVYFSITPQGGGPPPLPTLGLVPSTASTASTSSSMPVSSSTLLDSVPSPTASDDSARSTASGKAKNHTPEIIGVTIGVIFVLLVVGALIIWKRISARKAKERFIGSAASEAVSTVPIPYSDWRESPGTLVYNNVPMMDYKARFSRSGQPQPGGQSTDLLMESESSSGQSAGPSGSYQNLRAQQKSRRESTASAMSTAPSYHTTATRPG